MEVILREEIENLGRRGEVVKVAAGYARNFLLPKGKALRATKANLAYFESQKAQLEATNLQRRQEDIGCVGQCHWPSPQHKRGNQDSRTWCIVSGEGHRVDD